MRFCVPARFQVLFLTLCPACFCCFHRWNSSNGEIPGFLYSGAPRAEGDVVYPESGILKEPPSVLVVESGLSCVGVHPYPRPGHELACFRGSALSQSLLFSLWPYFRPSVGAGLVLILLFVLFCLLSFSLCFFLLLLVLYLCFFLGVLGDFAFVAMVKGLWAA